MSEGARFPGRPRRVLIVRLSAIGDTILTTPLLAALKDAMPDVEVDWVIEPKSRPILDMAEGLSRIHVFPRLLKLSQIARAPGKLPVLLRDLRALRAEMAGRQYDLCFDVQGLIKSGVASGISGARWKVGWRAADSRELNWMFTSDRLRMPKGVHVVDAWLSMLGVIGLPATPARFPLRPPADALRAVEAARLAWDVDLLAPGRSGNLVARIPGNDASRAVILGAHIDSPNNPGALDDGSGSAILLEVARVLDEAGVRPPTDLYLAWFGSEELSLYGSAFFAATHQDLLDRTVAMLQIDCLSRPLEGVPAELKLVSWPYGRLGDESLPWPDYLAGVAARHGVEAVTEAVYGVYSDDSSFGGFDVPHADLIYEPVAGAYGGVHYAGHMHDPYDTVALAREVGDVFEEMARVALAAALETDLPLDALRVTPPARHRALFVASHTQVAHMSPTTLTDLGMALAMEGFDVDLVPYGRAVTAADLEGADLVVALPPIDYAPDGPGAGLAEDWSAAEVEALAAHVAGGGLLVVTNSAGRLKYGNQALDPNEDWAGANPLAERLGLAFEEGAVTAAEARPVGDHPLLAGIRRLELGSGTAVPLRLLEGSRGQVLAEAQDVPAAILADHGQGRVLALGDLALFVVARQESQNMRFWRNLAAYARGEGW